MANNIEWREIRGFEGYEVSSNGDVRSYRIRNSVKLSETPKELKGGINIKARRHYVQYNLRKNDKTFRVYAHRLVADSFLLNPERKLQVNHIDNNPRNNHVSNLEWVTPQENTNHWVKFYGENKKSKKKNTRNKIRKVTRYKNNRYRVDFYKEKRRTSKTFLNVCEAYKFIAKLRRYGTPN
jgi:hypothetical protein